MYININSKKHLESLQNSCCEGILNTVKAVFRIKKLKKKMHYQCGCLSSGLINADRAVHKNAIHPYLNV